MSGRKQWLDWIEEKDQEQVRWALRYLAKAKVPLPDAPSPLDQLRSIHNDWLRHTSPLDELTYTRLVAAMKAAWRKHTSRHAQPNRKPYSFEMDREVGIALKRLSKESGLPGSQVVEHLVLNADLFRSQMAQRKKEEIAKLGRRGDDADLYAKRRKQQIEGLQAIVREWETTAEGLLTQGARNWVRLNAAGLLEGAGQPILTPPQEIAAARLARRWNEALLASIKANTRLARLSLGHMNQLLESSSPSTPNSTRDSDTVKASAQAQAVESSQQGEER